MIDTSWRPQVGERVRVRDGVGVTITCPHLPHFPDEGGHVGTIVSTRAARDAPDHQLLVHFDRPVPLVSMIGTLLPLSARHYAADEIEPVDG